MKKTLEQRLKETKKKRQPKPRGLIRNLNLTSAEIILKSGEKFKGIIHIQRTSKTEKLEGNVISFTRNKNKIVFFEDKDEPNFTQLSSYAQKPFQFMIVSGTKYIIMPFDVAFGLKEGLTKYLEYVKTMKVE